MADVTSQPLNDTKEEEGLQTAAGAGETSRTNHRTVPITLLPLEMLQEIFHHHPGLHAVRDPDDNRPHACKRGTRCGPYCWVPTVSHVCRRWRSAGIHCPSLWRRITITPSTEWVKTVLSRSGTVPLDVYSGFDVRLPDAMRIWDIKDAERWLSLEAVLAQMPRIRTLYLIGQVKRDILQLLKAPAPMLRMLYVVGFNLPGSVIHLSATTSTLISRDSSPRLERLTLSGVLPLVELRVSCSSSLKHLTISFDYSRRIQVSCQDILNAVAQMLSLESLIIHASAIRSSYVQPSITPIKLARLQTLEVDARSEYLAHILCSLEMPCLSRLYMGVNLLSESQGLLPHLLTTTSTLAELHTMDVIFTSRWIIKGFHDSRSEPVLHIVVRPPPSFEVMATWFLHLPLQSVRTLKANPDYYYVGDEWVVVLPTFDNVTELCVTGAYGARALRRPLSWRTSMQALRDRGLSNDDRQAQCCLPRLRVLALHEARFGDAQIAESGELSDSKLVKGLKRALMRRAVDGIGLTELRLVKGVNLDAGRATALEGAAESVSWDGIIAFNKYRVYGRDYDYSGDEDSEEE